MSQPDLIIIGGGNMGEALLRGVLRAALVPAGLVVLVEPVAEKRERVASELGVTGVVDLAQAGPAGRYVLAVKPQQVDAVVPALRTAVGGGALVISIVAGLSTHRLSRALCPAARVVRAMPNTPMLVGRGCTGLCAGPGASVEDLAFAERLFAAGGMVWRIDEAAMDALTAVSGSGPAYFFYLIEAMVEAGVAEGLPADTAADLAVQTCVGAAALLAESGQSAADLRAKVTSPGGVTQAAIETLERAGVRGALVRAVRAAADRSRQLGR